MMESIKRARAMDGFEEMEKAKLPGVLYHSYLTKLCRICSICKELWFHMSETVNLYRVMLYKG